MRRTIDNWHARANVFSCAAEKYLKVRAANNWKAQSSLNSQILLFMNRSWPLQLNVFNFCLSFLCIYWTHHILPASCEFTLTNAENWKKFVKFDLVYRRHRIVDTYLFIHLSALLLRMLFMVCATVMIAIACIWLYTIHICRAHWCWMKRRGKKEIFHVLDLYRRHTI